MVTKYKIGNKTIDLLTLVAVGKLNGILSGIIDVPIAFNFNSNVVIQFEAGSDGAPPYHNSRGDWTEEDSDFWRYVQSKVDEMIKAWEAVGK